MFLFLYCLFGILTGSQASDDPFYLLDKNERRTLSGYGVLMYKGGTVCDYDFIDATAERVCQMMGYSGASEWNNAVLYSFQNNYNIRMASMSCTGHTFASCTYYAHDDYAHDAYTGCTHHGDVWLRCRQFPLKCPAGYYVQWDTYDNIYTCRQCLPGTYTPLPNVDTSCLACPANSVSLQGATHCDCLSGFFWEEDTCVQCHSGTVSMQGSTSSSDCVKCPPGSMLLNDMSACSCSAKGHGWIWTQAGNGSCSPCPANTNKDKETGKCREYPREATSLPGSVSCQCASGLSWDGTNCVDCAAGGTQSGLCNCSAGQFWNKDNIRCDVCPLNHYSENASSSCSKCPNNTISEPGSSSCTPCQHGYFWVNHTCLWCPHNQIGNGITCSRCPGDTSPSDDGTICLKSTHVKFVNLLTWILISLLTITMIIVAVLSITIILRTKRVGKETVPMNMVYRAQVPQVEEAEYMIDNVLNEDVKSKDDMIYECTNWIGDMYT